VIIGLQLVDYSNTPRAFKVCSHDYDLCCNFSIDSKDRCFNGQKSYVLE